MNITNGRFLSCMERLQSSSEKNGNPQIKTNQLWYEHNQTAKSKRNERDGIDKTDIFVSKRRGLVLPNGVLVSPFFC